MFFRKHIILLTVGVVVLFLLSVFIWALPAFTKYYIEKNSQELIGRRVQLERIALNPLNGVIRIHDFRMYEADGAEVFLSFELFHLNFSLPALIKNRLDVSSVEIRKPYLNLVQAGERFNFHDLTERFSPSDYNKGNGEGQALDWAYNIGPMYLSGGCLRYSDLNLGALWHLDSIEVALPMLSSSVDTIEYALGLVLREGGKLVLSGHALQESGNYALQVLLDKLNTEKLLPYLLPAGSSAIAGGLFSLDLAARGSYIDTDRFSAKAVAAIDDVYLAPAVGDTLLAWRHFLIEMDTLVLEREYFEFGKIVMQEPLLKYELYDDSDNISRILFATGLAVSDSLSATGEEESIAVPDSTAIRYDNPFTILADYLQLATRNYVSSNYLADSLVMTRGRFIFTDYTTDEPFRIELSDMLVTADKFRSADGQVAFHVSSYINGPGVLNADLIMNTANYSDFELNFEIDGFYIRSFSPYTAHYTSHPIWDGNLKYISRNRVQDGYLTSENTLNISKIDVGKKSGKQPQYDVPLRLAVALLRDVNGNVNLEIPVEGDLRDPKYKLGKVIIQILTNLVVKAVSAPFRLLAGVFGQSEAEMSKIEFDNIQSSLGPEQTNRLRLIEKVLRQKPELKAELTQVYDAQVELANLALYKARKDYLSGQDTVAQALDLTALGQQDSSFVRYLALELGIPDSAVFVDMAVLGLYDREKLISEVESAGFERDRLIAEYLYGICGLPEERVELKRLTDVPDSLSRQPHPVYLIHYTVE